MPLYLSDEMLSQISLQKFHDFIFHIRYRNLPPLPLEIWVHVLLYCDELYTQVQLIKAHSQLQLLMDTSTALRKEIVFRHIVCYQDSVYQYEWRCSGKKGVTLLSLATDCNSKQYKYYSLIRMAAGDWKVIFKDNTGVWEETKTTIYKWNKWNYDKCIILEELAEDQILEAPLCYLVDFLQKFVSWFQDNAKKCRRRKSPELIDFIMSHFPFHHFY